MIARFPGMPSNNDEAQIPFGGKILDLSVSLRSSNRHHPKQKFPIYRSHNCKLTGTDSSSTYAVIGNVGEPRDLQSLQFQVDSIDEILPDTDYTVKGGKETNLYYEISATEEEFDACDQDTVIIEKTHLGLYTTEKINNNNNNNK